MWLTRGTSLAERGGDKPSLKEYLPSLQERPKCKREQKNLRVGDLVLIVDDNVNRNQWPLGRVVNVFPGVDNLVRSTELQAKGTTLKPQLTKLCLLEGVNDE